MMKKADIVSSFQITLQGTHEIGDFNNDRSSWTDRLLVIKNEPLRTTTSKILRGLCENTSKTCQQNCLILIRIEAAKPRRPWYPLPKRTACDSGRVDVQKRIRIVRLKFGLTGSSVKCQLRLAGLSWRSQDRGISTQRFILADPLA